MTTIDLAPRLLDWYDRAHRDLPWRVPPAETARGARPDPYRIWLSEIMLQQTSVAAVKAYFNKFTALWPRVEDLAAADLDAVLRAWAGLGYYARARNLHKCARTVASELGGVFPDHEAGLRTLPGVGPYTAAVIAAIVFDRAAVVVDGNVERVMARLYAVAAPLPGSKGALRALAARSTPRVRPGDYAQAVMDLGATVCVPRRPACGLCPWRRACAAHAAGIADQLPRKTPKKPKPARRGVAFLVVRADGAALLDRRAEAGLLGGMMELPGSDWTEAGPSPAAIAAAAPLAAEWRALDGEVRHVFTHFSLNLTLMGARAGMAAAPRRGWFIPRAQLMEQALPSLMVKALKLGLPQVDRGRGGDYVRV